MRPESLLTFGLLLTMIASFVVFYNLQSGSGINDITQFVHILNLREENSGLKTRGRLRMSQPSNSSFFCRAEEGTSSIFSLHSSNRLGKLNDDYCDCHGESLATTDEPATSACSNIIRDKSFFCGWNPQYVKMYGTSMSQADIPLKYPFYPALVYASRVHDGVCDCCDGADEVRQPLPLVAVPESVC